MRCSPRTRVRGCEWSTEDFPGFPDGLLDPRDQRGDDRTENRGHRKVVRRVRQATLGPVDPGVVSEDGDLFATRDLPCVPTGPLALRTTRSYLLVCDGEARATADAGRTWRALAAPPGAGAPLVTPRSLFVAGDAGLLASRDEGRSWHRALDVKVRAAGFESSRLGFVIDTRGVMRLSRDDGRSWEQVDFRRTR